MTDVAVAEDGLLWVLLQAPHPNWRDALTGESDEHGLRRVRWDRPYVVAILEVIDPSRGHVVARHRFTHGLWGLTSAHVVSNTNGVWRTWTDETTGEPRVEVTVIRLRGR